MNNTSSASSTTRQSGGYFGFLCLMQRYLQNYVDFHDSCNPDAEGLCYGVEAAREVIVLLHQLEDPYAFLVKRLDEHEAEHPEYCEVSRELLYRGETIYGNYIKQDGGWAGIGSGRNPKEGFFAIIDGEFRLTESPEPAETDRLVAIAKQHRADMWTAEMQAEADTAEIIDKVAELLKKNMYLWRSL